MTYTRYAQDRGEVRAVKIAVTTTGSAGSATGNTTSPPIVGQILGFQINYHASAPAGTTDILIADATSALNFYAKTNSVTDVYVVPSIYGLDNAGAALSGDVTPQRYCVAGGIKVTINQSDALTNCVVVTVFYQVCNAEIIAVTTVGGAGVATGNTTSGAIRGEILGILADYHASAPGTSDIIVEMATTGIDLYAKNNTVTDAFSVPVIFSVDNTNGAIASDVTPRHYCVSDKIKVTLNQADALTNAVIVTVFWVPCEVVRANVTTIGSAGSATGTIDVPVDGEIIGIVADFHASAPGTTDITVEYKESGIDIWARANSVTDAYAVPGLKGLDSAAAALTSNVTPDLYTAHDLVTVSLAQADALTNCVIADIFFRRN